MQSGSSGVSYEMALAAALALAASCDLALRRIPNWLTVLTAATGVGARALQEGAGAALSGVAAALVVGALVAPFWMRRLIGAGDLKLAAATAAWIGLAGTPRFLLATCAAGGLVSVACYLSSGASERAAALANLAQMKTRALPIGRVRPAGMVVPYGIAVAAGAAFAVWG